MRRIAFALIDAWYAIQHRLPARLLLWRPMAFVCSWIATWEICLMDTNGEIAQAVQDMRAALGDGESSDG